MEKTTLLRRVGHPRRDPGNDLRALHPGVNWWSLYSVVIINANKEPAEARYGQEISRKKIFGLKTGKYSVQFRD